jgi:GDP-L-fucose synthase
MEKTSKIYVAGHRGLVGSSLIRTLQRCGYSKIVTKTSSELDLTRQTDTEDFFEKERPEYVFLAAAKVGGILSNSRYKAEFIYNNIMIASNVINSAYRYGVKKLLNLGSSCIYPRLAPQPIKEEYLLTGSLESTNEPYAIAKISAIKLCRYYNEQYGMDFISAMPTNLYGPYDNFNLETAHALPALIRKFHLAKLLEERNFAALNRDIQRYPLGFGIEIKDRDSIEQNLANIGIRADYVELWGSGQPYREFLYVDDLTDACIFLMNRLDYKEIGEFINVGTGQDIKIKDLAVLIKEIVGFKGNIRYDSTNPDGTPRKLLDISKITSLGWKPKTTLKEGLEKTYGWYLCE